MTALAQYIDQQNSVFATVASHSKLQVPTNRHECKPYFKRLVYQLSPENLYCDGESSQEQVNIKLRRIALIWDDLEEIIQDEVTQDEAIYF